MASEPPLSPASAAQNPLDPVCGMEVSPEDAAGRVEHNGRDYFFCSEHCVEAFRSDPQKYLHDSHAASDSDQRPHPSAPPAGGDYTCPMHPEVMHDGPGPCPKCGMALEPVLPAPMTEYTCPMHPQIVRDAPGSCPICGMALEPRVAATGEESNPELIDMTRRLWVATALAVPTLALAMVPDFLGVQVLDPGIRQWVQFA